MVKPIDPQPLFHGWPVYERDHRFVLGRVLDCPAIDERTHDTERAGAAIGRWECELARNALTWSNEVYDLFGLPLGERISRDEAVSLYCEHSRAVMEGLRAYSIQHKQGFVLDAEIRPGHGQRRWMRLIAVPVVEGDLVVRLHGSKQAI